MKSNTKYNNDAEIDDFIMSDPVSNARDRKKSQDKNKKNNNPANNSFYDEYPSKANDSSINVKEALAIQN